jgi:glycosyltransferase involved in cell wall biosynthesis
MRILRIIRSVNPVGGGPIEGVKQVSAIMNAEGVHTEVLCLDAPEDSWLEAFPLRCHALGNGRSGYGYSSRLVPWLLANRERFDVIIVHGIWLYSSWGAWRALRDGRVPYVVYTHGMLDPWFKRTYPLKHLKKWLYWPWAEYRVLRDAAAVLFTSSEECRLARESFWLYRAREVVIDYGTQGVPEPGRDYATPFLEKRPELTGYRRFVFLGRVHPKKGPDILIRALAALRDRGQWKSEGMRLIMAGPADGAYARELQALAADLGVSDSIVWTGMMQGADKWGALQSAEAFVLPSHQENFGIAVAEALSVGVPVLISKSVNIWADIVADGGGLADDDTQVGCERLWFRWLQMLDVERTEMSRQARRCFENRYTSKRAAESLTTVLKGLIARHKASSGGDR